jgi:hypothetical protein
LVASVVDRRPIEYVQAWLDMGLDAAWIELGLRKLEDYLLVHAAFSLEWPENDKSAP